MDYWIDQVEVARKGSSESRGLLYGTLKHVRASLEVKAARITASLNDGAGRGPDARDPRHAELAAVLGKLEAAKNNALALGDVEIP